MKKVRISCHTMSYHMISWHAHNFSFSFFPPNFFLDLLKLLHLSIQTLQPKDIKTLQPKEITNENNTINENNKPLTDPILEQNQSQSTGAGAGTEYNMSEQILNKKIKKILKDSSLSINKKTSLINELIVNHNKKLSLQANSQNMF